MLEDIFAAEEIKANTKAVRETNSGAQTYLANFNRKDMIKDRHKAAIAYRDISGFCFPVVYSKTNSFSCGEDAAEGAGIDIRLSNNFTCGTFDSEADYGAEISFVGFIMENYFMFRHRIKIETKSSGRGMGIQVGTMPGCFRRASLNNMAATHPLNGCPDLTTQY